MNFTQQISDRADAMTKFCMNYKYKMKYSKLEGKINIYDRWTNVKLMVV